MEFPLFSELPLELALEILHLAASPQLHPLDQKVYNTATSLAQVSHFFRDAVMPHLLHTIILSTQEKLNLFIRTIEQQENFKSVGHRLRLDYKEHIHRIWSTQCFEPLVQHTASRYANYNILYPIFSRAKTLGLNFNSLHLLYEVLGGAYTDCLPQWQCKRATFAGTFPRWNPITSTTAGLAFLRQLTHLTVWVSGEPASTLAPNQVPDWVEKVPFEYMPNLIHFAFSLTGSSANPTVPVLTYSLPAESLPGQSSSIFRAWAKSSDPLSYGVLSHFNAAQDSNSLARVDTSWERAYLRGEDEYLITSSENLQVV
ncbi:hypothetical protein B0H34DRAFT_372654 [Crassisporium funariophilum]|nr:hypothetical protein B0H34DRAFT_372654 [Crassisporium funariophilum]